MIYYGTIRDGQVVVEENVRLPEGAQVRIEVEGDASESAADPNQRLGQFWDALRELADTAQTLPPDIE